MMMKQCLILMAGIVLAMVLTAKAAVVWEEDFEDQPVGTTGGTNSDLGSTDVQPANGLTAEVVNAPGGMSYLSGKVILLTTDDNGYSAIRSGSRLNPIDLSRLSLSSNDTFTLSFDLYIPSTLTKAVGDVQFRWKNGSEDDGWPFVSTGMTLSAGEHRIVYSGTFADVGFIPTEVRPFIWFDQGSAITDYVYFDNLTFEVGDGPLVPTTGWDFADLKSRKVTSTPLVKWQHFGPGMSGYIDAFWINNSDPKSMYTALDMGNAHVTVNDGKYWTSWKEIDGTSEPQAIVPAMDFSFQDADFGLLTAKEGIYSTEDRGRSWDFVVDPDSSNSEKHSVMTVDPNDDNIWYIGAGQHWRISSTHWTKDGMHYTNDGNVSAGYILKSTDRGQSWTKVSFPHGDEDFSKIIIDPRNSNIVYATCQYGLFKSTNGGLNWSQLTGGGLPSNPPRDLGFYYDGADEFLLYFLAVTHYETSGSEVITSGGVYRSADGGANWNNITGDLGCDFTQITSYRPGWDYHQRYYRAVAWYLKMDIVTFAHTYDLPTNTFSQFSRMAVDPTNKDRIYLSHNYKHDYAFPPGNIWMTENGGTNWFVGAREGKYWDDETDKAYWQSRGVQPLGINCKLAHVDREHNVENNLTSGPRFVFCNQLGQIFTCFAQQMMRSNDHGATWNQMDDDEAAAGSGHWVGRGNSDLPGEDFCLDTGTPGTYLWVTGEHGLWRNTDDGDNVYPGAIAVEQLTGQSISNSDTLSPIAVAIHPHDKNKIYTLQSRQNLAGHLRYSSDNGAHWSTLSIPVVFPGTWDVIAQRSLMIDYQNPDNIYFCVPWSIWVRWKSSSVTSGREVTGNPDFFGQGIYKSADGGYNWSMVTNGIPANRSVHRMAMDPIDPQVIYAALNETHEQDPGGLYKTTDGGASWSEVSLPPGVVAVNHVQVHKTTRDIYMACGEYNTGVDVGGGFVSRDNGLSWEKLFDMPYLRHFSASLADPNVIVANVNVASGTGHLNPGAYVSIDGGKAWFKINNAHGQPDAIRKIEADPYDPNVLWMCLTGTGFFKADISPLRSGIAKPFFWDWMADHGESSIDGDSDGDGFSNRSEYLADTDPGDRNSYFKMNLVPNLGRDHQIQFESALNRTYTVDYTDELTVDWAVFTNGVPGTGSLIELMDSEDASNRFYRIKAEME